MHSPPARCADFPVPCNRHYKCALQCARALGSYLMDGEQQQRQQPDELRNGTRLHHALRPTEKSENGVGGVLFKVQLAYGSVGFIGSARVGSQAPTRCPVSYDSSGTVRF